jgi:multiple sugar transport system substrate-binding protein
MAGLAACSAGGSGADGGDGTLTLWTHNGGNEAELAVNQQIVDDFNASQDEYTVEIEAFPQDSYNDSVVAAATANNLPCILDVDAPNVPNWAWAGYLAPLGLPEETWAGQLAGTIGTVDGEVYSYGHYDVALAMYARSSALEAAGVRVPTIDSPWTRDEFADALAAIDALGEYAYPLDLGTAGTGEWLTYGYSPLLQSFGGDLIDRETYTTAEGVLNGPEAIAWAEWFRGLIEDGYIAQTSGQDSTADFVNGNSALVYSGSWANGTVTEALGDDVVVVPPPDLGTGPKIGAGSWQWAMSSGCESPEGARAYLEFAHQTKYFVAFGEALGLVPATEEAAAQLPSYAEGGRDRVFLEFAGRFAVVRPVTPAYPYITSVFQKATQDILAGGDPQTVLDKAVSDIDTDIRQNGNYEF